MTPLSWLIFFNLYPSRGPLDLFQLRFISSFDPSYPTFPFFTTLCNRSCEISQLRSSHFVIRPGDLNHLILLPFRFSLKSPAFPSIKGSISRNKRDRSPSFDILANQQHEQRTKSSRHTPSGQSSNCHRRRLGLRRSNLQAFRRRRSKSHCCRHGVSDDLFVSSSAAYTRVQHTANRLIPQSSAPNPVRVKDAPGSV